MAGPGFRNIARYKNKGKIEEDVQGRDERRL